jgi:hypothetical protein
MDIPLLCNEVFTLLVMGFEAESRRKREISNQPKMRRIESTNAPRARAHGPACVPTLSCHMAAAFGSFAGHKRAQ